MLLVLKIFGGLPNCINQLPIWTIWTNCAFVMYIGRDEGFLLTDFFASFDKLVPLTNVLVMNYRPDKLGTTCLAGHSLDSYRWSALLFNRFVIQQTPALALYHFMIINVL